ncbi:MAG: hypothetical protein U9Q15_05170 [Patescibacteria group bacterium]|nr:hypothetical protein [Patescibacteria group bacterium]
MIYIGIGFVQSGINTLREFDALDFIWNLGSDIDINNEKTNILLLGYG